MDQPAYVLKTLLAGGVAGCCAKSTTAPLDRLKILFQLKHQHYAGLNLWRGFLAIFAKEGAYGYFKGNGAMMARIFPYAALQYMSYEQYKKILWKLPQFGPLNKILTGSCAGITAVTFTYPLDMVRARLAFQVHDKYYEGIAHALQLISSEEGGFLALYRGFLPTVLGMIPYGGTAFYTYESVKAFTMQHSPMLVHSVDGVPMLSAAGSLMCGAISGLTAQVISYPFDVIRRRMQLASYKHVMTQAVDAIPPEHCSNPYRSWRQTFCHIYRSEGIRHGLYRGLSLNFVRVAPHTAISFTVYEQAKQFLGVGKPLV